MSEHKQEKWLYSFTIPKEVEVEKQVEEILNGETVKVTRKIKEKQDIKFAIKRPNRRMYENADLFYGVQLADFIRSGLLTKALLLKRYRNDGGALSSGDTAHFEALVQELAILEGDHQRFLANIDKLSKEQNDERVKKVYNQKIDVLQRLQAFETINRALFSHTAEAKADVQLANWWTIHLSYWDKNNDGNLVEFFEGKDFNQKMEFWDKVFDEAESFYLEGLARLSVVVGLWNAGATTDEDFEKGEKEQLTPAEKAEEKAPETQPAAS